MDKRSAILIIEDDAALRQGTARVLTEAGFQVFETATGEDGFVAACREVPALVLLDVCLPDTDGLDLCRRLKTDPALAGISVLLISDINTDVESLTEGFDGGTDGYLVRPLDNSELVARVRAMFRLKQAEDALRITERKQAESVLRQKAEELDHFFDLALDLLCIADIEGNFRRLNLAWETTLGYSREELLSHRFFDFVHPDDVAATIEAVSQLDAQKTVLNFTNRYRCKDGSYRWIEWRSAPAGKMIYAAARDITARKLAEAEIQQLNRTLEARVQQRTAELEAINRDLQHFVNAASHDLKTPLHGISRLATWLVQDYATAFDEQGREMAADLIQRVMRLDALLNGMLEYASLTQSAETFAPVALNDVLCYVLQELAPPKNIQIIYPENLPVIQGDARRIRKVFHHLLRNAIQFSFPAGGCVTITAQEGQMQWTFCVADTGVGIDPQYHAKIFNLFQRLDPHDDTSTGIGLALVKKIVERAGGQIWVESAIGKGSAFYFTLPK